ncbi:MAG: hypothetical protein ACM33B_14795 [Pseudomonadota bacterium]
MTTRAAAAGVAVGGVQEGRLDLGVAYAGGSVLAGVAAVSVGMRVGRALP